MASISSTVTETTKLIVLKKNPPKEKYRRDYKPPQYTVTHVSLDFDLAYEATTVTAKLDMHRMPATPAAADLVLDGDSLQLKAVSLNGRKLHIGQNEGSEAIHTDSEGLVISGKLLPTVATETFQVETVVTINPTKNTVLMGLFKTDSLLATQCEPHGFRRITFMLDRPDVMATYCVRMQGSKRLFPVLLSNGNEIDRGNVSDDVHYTIYKDPHPKPSYLFGLVAGPLESITEVYRHPDIPDSKPVRIHIWSEASNLPKLHWAMESIKSAMKWDTDTFGLDYDLDVFNLVCIRDFNMGAMENKSLNIFVSAALLASPQTTSDMEYLRILGIVAHEYFHNWTGDRVTLRDWFQLTLKEGLTVYRDQLFSADMGSAAVKRIESVIDMRSRQFPEDSGPMAHPIRPESYISMENFYTVTVYEKGAEVIRMFHTILGTKGFRKGMDLYFQRHDGHAVTCDDFRAAMADANEYDFTQFERWYSVKGIAIVTVVSSQYDSKTRKLNIRLRQRIDSGSDRSQHLPLYIPVELGLIGRASREPILPTRLLHFTKADQTFEIEDVSEDPILSIFRGWSAPVKLEIGDEILSCRDQAILMGYDCDPFNKWDAGQQVMMKILLQRAKDISSGDLDAQHPPPLPDIFVDALRNLIKNYTQMDKSLLAYMFVTPSEEVISNEMSPSDPIAISHAKDSMRKQIAHALYDDFKEVYDELTKLLEYKEYKILPASENVAPRQLRNLCLSYLSVNKDSSAISLADTHYKKATNMTDRLAALRCLVDCDCPERDAALQSFYDEANGDPLVIDKWFSLQAGADVADILTRVAKLREHPLFSLTTPGRMRAVLHRFAYNYRHFHRIDGKGYKMIADAVLEIDPLNPSNAARLAIHLGGWQKYDAERGRMMRDQLQRMMESQSLSSETYEVVHKSLAVRS